MPTVTFVLFRQGIYFLLLQHKLITSGARTLNHRFDSPSYSLISRISVIWLFFFTLYMEFSGLSTISFQMLNVKLSFLSLPVPCNSIQYTFNFQLYISKGSIGIVIFLVLFVCVFVRPFLIVCLFILYCFSVFFNNACFLKLVSILNTASVCLKLTFFTLYFMIQRLFFKD